MRYLIPLMLLAGCGPAMTEKCVIGHNINILPQNYDGAYPPYSCEHFQQALYIIDEVARETVLDPRFYFFSSHVENMTVEVRRENVWKRFDLNTTMSGEALCGVRHIYINSAENILFSSFAHEMAHIVQECHGSPTIHDAESIDSRDVDHRNWHHDGIYLMIDRIHARATELK